MCILLIFYFFILHINSIILCNISSVKSTQCSTWHRMGDPWIIKNWVENLPRIKKSIIVIFFHPETPLFCLFIDFSHKSAFHLILNLAHQKIFLSKFSHFHFPFSHQNFYLPPRCEKIYRVLPASIFSMILDKANKLLIVLFSEYLVVIRNNFIFGKFFKLQEIFILIFIFKFVTSK